MPPSIQRAITGRPRERMVAEPPLLQFLQDRHARRAVWVIATAGAVVWGCVGAALPGAEEAAMAGADAGAGVEVGGPDAPGLPAADTAGGPPCPAGAGCDDGNPCTAADLCDAKGVCAGAPADCGDGLPCTADHCDGAKGCLHELLAGYCVSELGAPHCVAANQTDPEGPCRYCAVSEPPTFKDFADGAPCEDDDACSAGDSCELGSCKAGPTKLACDAEGPCDVAACEATAGCVHTPLEGQPCDDGSACTTGDLCDATGACAGLAASCDDGLSCTVDACDPGSGCAHTPDACADADPCTLDGCQELNGCMNTPHAGPCEDGEPCTQGESCATGVCTGGVAMLCQDDNACTEDLCGAGGCVFAFLAGPCDDGESCTTGDTCTAGVCGGVKSTCAACLLPETNRALRLNSIAISDDGSAGGAVDVDADAATCAPEGDCSGGLDNALALLAPVLNPELDGALAQGTVNVVADLTAATADGEPFVIQAYAAAEMSLSCVPTTEICPYQALQESFDAGCKVVFSLDDASVDPFGQLTAGGKGSTATLGLYALGSTFYLTAHWARLQAQVTWTAEGAVATLQGVLGGAVQKAALEAIVGALDEEALPFPKDLIVLVLDSLVPDMDVDGDGQAESLSLGLQVSGTRAELVVGWP